MASTENLLQDVGDKSTNTLESGYHSEGAENDLPRSKHKEKTSKKKETRRDVGLENKGFEYENEQANTGVEQGTKLRRRASENTLRKSTKVETKDDKRRHSFAGQLTGDSTQLSEGVTQKTSKTRRRSSSADEDLRRLACYNSMRLRRVSSSSSSQLPPSEVDMSVDDEVFYENTPVKGSQRKHQEISYGEKSGITRSDRANSMGSLCSVVELENRKLDEYSKRLLSALQERARLEQQLNILRQTASVASMPAEEKWKISPRIHFRNEKYNSERRLSTREDKQFSYEQLKRIQHEHSRRLPEVPRAIGCEDDEIHEELNPKKNVERLPQEKRREESPQRLEEKRQGYKRDKLGQETENRVERLPYREGSEEFPHLEEKHRSYKRNEYEEFEEMRPVIEKKDDRLPQRKGSEEYLQPLEEKRPSYKDDEIYGELHTEVERMPQRKGSEEYLQPLEEKRQRNKDDEIYGELRPVIERLPQGRGSEEFTQQLEEKSKSDNFRRNDSERERRERKMADLAADLWKKLVQGEKFHVEGEASKDKTATKSPEGTTKGKNASEAKKMANSSYANAEVIEKASDRERIARLAEDSTPTTSGLERREKPLVRSESESNLARNDAFRRNQRRPLRYKRASASAESLAGTEETKPSSSTFNEHQANKPKQEKPDKLDGVRSTEAVSQSHSKWFNYMLPPGKRGNREGTPQRQTSRHAPQESQQETMETAPSQLSDKLRYYRELLEQRSQEENTLDLADAYMAAEDAEAEREYQRKAAGEAAILRREASRMLYEAMNLERICDPNARVRHIFTPY